tara:strand:- start:50 stop:565 length:516 start_codon:yes stop_codon:yes gene_type:complete
MLWETTIDFSKEELDTLNNFAIQYEGSSEEKVPNILLNFPFALEKINILLNNYLPKDYEKYLVQSWSIFTPKGYQVHSNPHNHGYCHFSFIFYTKSLGDTALILKDANNLEFRKNFKTKDFIIIPPQQIHMIEIGEVKSDRVSFVGDILLTEKEYKSSMFLPPINNWKKLK